MIKAVLAGCFLFASFCLSEPISIEQRVYFPARFSVDDCDISGLIRINCESQSIVTDNYYFPPCAPGTKVTFEWSSRFPGHKVAVLDDELCSARPPTCSNGEETARYLCEGTWSGRVTFEEVIGYRQPGLKGRSSCDAWEYGPARNCK